MFKRARKAVFTAYLATFTVLVFIATSIIAVEVPATKGFFNLGETMVYTAAILGGPIVGCIAGGLGSSLADLYLGYPHYAPGTLVIKGVEGFIVGYLVWLLKRTSTRWWRLTTVAVAIASFTLISYLGYTYYRGETVLYILNYTVKFSIPGLLWFILGFIVALLVVYTGFRSDPRIGGEVVAIIVGGLEMVLGYFIYQVAVLGYLPVVAALEIPVNLGQLSIGLLVAVPLVRVVKAMGAPTPS